MKGATIWLTGLSGSGKSTIARLLKSEFEKRGVNHEVLDGDIVRTNLTKGLGFSKEDRDENIKRIGFVSHLLTRNDVFTIVAAISPYNEVRSQVKSRIGDMIEVHVNAPLETCEGRDVKGLYVKARAGEIKGFTGIDDPYEAPETPEVVCHTHEESVEESTQKILNYLIENNYLDN